jgi:mRNA interferase YafQ
MQKALVVMRDIENETLLDPKYHEHLLVGNYAGSTECHIEPNWLLIYEIHDEDADNKEVYFARMGTHSDVFD